MEVVYKEMWIGMDWLCVQKRDDESLKRAGDLEMDGVRGEGRPLVSWKRYYSEIRMQ